MEPNNTGIFESGLDETAAAYLLETTRWTKFLAIIGFILSAGMLIIAFIFFYANGNDGPPEIRGRVLGTTLYFVLMACLYIYPAYALMQFSSCIKKGIHQKEQQLINRGLRAQKNMYRYMGILTIIALVFLLMGFLVMEMQALS